MFIKIAKADILYMEGDGMNFGIKMEKAHCILE